MIADACTMIRAEIPRASGRRRSAPKGTAPAKSAEGLYDLLPDDHRLPYDMEEVIARIVDADDYLEFQPEHAPEMLCAHARLHGRPIGVIANRRGFLKTAAGPRIGGIVYTESARKVAYFVENAERQGCRCCICRTFPGSWWAWRPRAKASFARAPRWWRAMACATVPKIILTLNHASGAGYYAMAGQGFDPHFAFAWPTARIGVMEGDAAVQAVHGPELEK